MKNFIKKFINGQEDSIVYKNNNIDKPEILNKSYEYNNNYLPFYKELKEFLTNGNIIEKSYNSLQIVDNTLTLPTEISNYFISKIKDISILKFLKIINTDSNSIVVPIQKGDPKCIWHEYGKSPDHDNQEYFENKLITIGAVSTCPSVSKDFLFKNENCVLWLMDKIINDIYNEVCLSIFNNNKEIDKSQYVDSLFKSLDNKRKKNIKYKPKEKNIVLSLQEIINNVEGIYRTNGKFFISRKFFHNLIEELLDFNHPLCNFILNNNSIFGYQYYIVEQIEDNIAIFGDLSAAYTLIVKNDQYLERDSITKKHFIQFFYAHSFGGTVVNDDSIFVLEIDKPE
jgi:HK97 family phage major capsid protein